VQKILIYNQIKEVTKTEFVNIFEFYIERMMEMKYSILDNSMFESVAPAFFAILANNMTKICSTGRTYEEDYSLWHEDVSRLVQNDKVNFAVATEEESGEIAAFFEYHIDGDTFVMDEFQISEKYHGKGNVFRDMYGFIIDNIGEECSYVEAASNKLNKKSIGVLGTLGLKIVGELHEGSCVQLRGNFADLIKWYRK